MQLNSILLQHEAKQKAHSHQNTERCQTTARRACLGDSNSKIEHISRGGFNHQHIQVGCSGATISPAVQQFDGWYQEVLTC